MRIVEREPPPDREYSAISIAFDVTQVLDVLTDSAGIHTLAERPRDVSPYHKDYDEAPGHHPLDWRKYRTDNWGVFMAMSGDLAVGGAVVAWRTPGLDVLESRDDLAVLWDLRVHPDYRGQGIGAKLFQHSADWSRRQGASQLKIETQNTNLPACTFYERRGCHLGSIEPGVYRDFPDEARLHWYLTLGT